MGSSSFLIISFSAVATALAGICKLDKSQFGSRRREVIVLRISSRPPTRIQLVNDQFDLILVAGDAIETFDGQSVLFDKSNAFENEDWHAFPFVQRTSAENETLRNVMRRVFHRRQRRHVWIRLSGQIRRCRCLSRRRKRRGRNGDDGRCTRFLPTRNSMNERSRR